MDRRLTCLLLVVLCAWPDSSPACSPPDDPVEEILARQDVILRGRILSIELVESPQWGDTFREWTVEVYAWWRDPGGEYASIVKIHDPLEMCTTGFGVGAEGVFTASVVPGDWWVTSWGYSWTSGWQPGDLDHELGPPLKVPLAGSGFGTLKARYY